MISVDELLKRFPALLRLISCRIKKRVPVLRQNAATDCGATALAIVLEYYGRSVSIAELQGAIGGAGHGGVTAQSLLRVARSYGLRGRGVRAELEDVVELPTSTILFWEFCHYVVLERVSNEAIEIVDPAIGRRSISVGAFRRSFTGVALLLEPDDNFHTHSVSSNKVIGLLSQLMERRDLFFRVAAVSLLGQVLLLIVPITMSILADRVVPRRDYSLLALSAVGYIAFQGFGIFASFVRAHLMIHLQTQIESRFTLRFLGHLVDLPYSFFAQRTCGDLMVRLGATSTIRSIVTSSLLSALLDSFMAFMYLPLMFWFSGVLTCIVLLLAGTRISLMVIARWYQRKQLAESIDNQARSQTFQVEMLSGMETLKSMGLERDAAERWSHVFVDGLNIEIRRGRLNAYFSLATGFASGLSILATLFYGTYLVLNGNWTFGMMLAFNAVAAGFLGPLGNIVSASLQMQMVEVYIDRLNDVLKRPPEQDESKASDIGAVMGQICLESVSFHYNGEDALVIKDINMLIPPGSRVALVGKTGSGKSTLARLIAGLYEPTKGRVLIDDRDLQSLNRRSLRGQIGVVNQNADLFGGSIRRNIALTDVNMSFDRVVRAAKLACIHDEIVSMGMGYDTPLSDRGSSVSGGQRQRIAIARAIARNPRILVLDEATSHLDALTEVKVHQNLKSLSCTVVAVAHRLSSIRDADLIFLLDSGRIIEYGTHDQLLASRGNYFELVNSQFETMVNRRA